MRTNKPMTQPLRYFFRHLEKRSAQIQDAIDYESSQHQELAFDDVEHFFRQLMTQNIFIHTVGMNGKRESTILAKALFSMNKVVRLYYSTSFDEDQNGFIRIRPDKKLQTIIVERLHGYRPKPEVLYVSARECHVIRFMVRWLMRRIDWEKTKLNNLDLYKTYQTERQEEYEAQIAEAAARQEEEELQRTLEKHTKNFKERRKSKVRQ